MEQENRMNLRLPLVDVTNGAASLEECKREVEFSVNFGAGPLGIEFQPENEEIGCQVLRLHELSGQDNDVQSEARSLVRAGDCILSIDGDQVREKVFADIVNILRNRCRSRRAVRFVRCFKSQAIAPKELFPKLEATVMMDRVLATREALRKAKTERRNRRRRKMREATRQNRNHNMAEDTTTTEVGTSPSSSTRTSPIRSHEVAMCPKHESDDRLVLLAEARAETDGALHEAKRCRLELEQSRHAAEQLSRELDNHKEKHESDLEACRRAARDEIAMIRESAERDLMEARRNFHDVSDGWRLASDAVLAAIRADHIRALDSAKEATRLEARRDFASELDIMKHQLKDSQTQCLELRETAKTTEKLRLERDTALEQLNKFQHERQRQMQRLKIDAARALSDGRIALREERKNAARDAATAAAKAAQELSKAEAQTKIDSLQAELAAVRADRDTLEHRLAQDVSQLTRRLTELHLAADQQRKNLIERQEATSATDCAIAAEAARRDAEERFIEDATARAQAHAEEVHQLQANLARALSEVETQKTARSAQCDLKLSHLRTELAARQEHIESLQSEHTATVSTLRIELSENRKHIESLQAEHRGTITNLKDNLSESQQRIDTLKAEHSATLLKLQTELTATKNELEALRKEKYTADTIETKRIAHVKHLEATIQSREEWIRNHSDAIAASENRRAEMQRELDELRAKQKSSAQVNESEISTREENDAVEALLLMEAQQSEFQNEAAQRDIATREARIEELSSALQQLRIDSAARETRLSDRVNNYASQVTELRLKLQKVQSQEDVISELSLSLEAAAEENKELALKLSQAQQATAAANKAAHSLLNDSASLHNVQQEEAAVDDRLAAARAEVSARLASTERQATSLRSRLTEAAKLAAKEVLESCDEKARQDAELVCSEIAVLQRAIDASSTESTIVRTIVACL